MSPQQEKERKQFQISDDYVEVSQRIVDLYEKYPEAVLEGDYVSVAFGQTAYIVYTARCWRKPDDVRPCVGIAMEEIPGRTPYTKGSEIQNAETSAWGRAIIAAGASQSKRIASADEVRSAEARREHDADASKPAPKEHIDAFTAVMNAIEDPKRRAEVKTRFTTQFGVPQKLTMGQLEAATAYIYEAIPELKRIDYGASDPAAAPPSPEASDDAAPDEPHAPDQGEKAPARDADSGTGGSEAGAGAVGQGEASPPPAPARPSTSTQRRTIGMAFKKLEEAKVLDPGAKAEIVGYLTNGRTSTTTEIYMDEAVKLIALVHYMEAGSIEFTEGELRGIQQPGTSFLEQLDAFRGVM